MKIQTQASKMTTEAIEALLRTIKFIPADKWDWSPMGSARSVCEQLAECVQFAEMAASFITADIIPPRDSEKIMAHRQRIRENYPDADAMSDLARARYRELCAVIESCPDSRLEQEFTIPLRRAVVRTGADLLFLAYWNLVYHTGQVNYLQTMLGDTEMH